jgi:hypothetical protein
MENAWTVLPFNIATVHQLFKIHTRLPVTKTEELRGYATVNFIPEEKRRSAAHCSRIGGVDE